ncbi:MAG TPA: hypothetical protein VIK01_22090 [Polyangiaceae bacterium]
MQALKAHVVNGHFAIDERTDLPEGAEVGLQLVKVRGPSRTTGCWGCCCPSFTPAASSFPCTTRKQ